MTPWTPQDIKDIQAALGKFICVVIPILTCCYGAILGRIDWSIIVGFACTGLGAMIGLSKAGQAAESAVKMAMVARKESETQSPTK